MKEMKTLTINGVTYTVADPDAAHIDDAKALAGAVWSSKSTVDRLCPAFSESGAVVACEPVEGYPLSVVSRIEPVQEGSGDPYPPSWNEVSGTTVTADSLSTFSTEGDPLIWGKTYRLAVNVTNSAGERVKLAEGCDAMIVDGEGIFPYMDVTVGDYYLEFTMYVGDIEEGSYAVIGNLAYAAEVDESSVFDEDELSGEKTLKDGVFTLQEYDPGNIRPIGGHTAVTLRRSGKNLCDANSFTFTQILYHKLATPIPPGTYKVSYDNVTSADTDTSRCQVRFYSDYAGESLGYVMVDRGVSGVHTITLTQPAKYIYFYAAEHSAAGKDDTATFTNFMVSAAGGAYEPYRGGEFTVDLGQTVYGGSLNWQTGVLTVDRKQVKLTELSWIYAASIHGFRTPSVPDIAVPTAWYQALDVICSAYKTGTANSAVQNDCEMTQTITQPSLYIRDDRAQENVEQFIALNADTQICYKLAEPITVQLTPREILALSGSNILYSDTGDTQVSGRADPRENIEKARSLIDEILKRVAALEAKEVTENV